MAATARWYSEEKTAVLIEMNPPSNWDEFHECVRKAHTLIREVSHQVCLIVYPQGKLPEGNPLTQFRMAFNKQPANVSKVIIIIPMDGSRAMVSFVKRLSSIIQQVYRTKSKTVFVTSPEEATAQLEQPVRR